MKILAFLAALLFAVPALAQGVGPVAPIPSEVVPFNPTGQAALTAGVTSTRVALPSNGKTAVIRNNGAVTAFLAFGNVTVAATVNAYPLPAGTSISYNMFPVTQPAAYTYVAAITASSSAVLSITTGSGQPFISGGVSSTVISGTADVNITQVGSDVIDSIALSTVNPSIFQNAMPSASVGFVFDPVGLTVAKSIVPYADNLSREGLPAAGLMGYEAVGGVWDRVQVGTGGELKVTGTVTATPSGTQAANITSIGGNAVTTTLPVSGLASDNADNVAASATGKVPVISHLAICDNATAASCQYDLVRSASTQVSGGMVNTGMIASQLFARTDDSNVLAPAAINGNTDTNGTTVTGLSTVNKSLTYDQVGNTWVRERYPSISSTNSSTAALGGGAVFTGTSVNIQGYGSATVSVISNVASATNGLSIQQSSDSTNWDLVDTYTVAAGVASKINVPRQAVFLRVVYTNGGSAQASFRLQTLLDTQMPTASSLKPLDGMSLENDFAGVLSIPALSSGTVLNVGKDITGAVAAGTGTTAVHLAPTSVVGATTSDSHCTAACASTLVSGAHNLYGANFSATVSGWLLVYDSLTCGANGTVSPLRTYAYPTANLSATVSWGSTPLRFATGIALCFSTTGPYTATASTTAFIAADYK